MRLCQYRDIFGAPREGIHAYRIPYVDMAAVDVLLTIALAIVIWFCLGQARRWWLLPVLVIGFYILGEQLHYLFCVPTQMQLLLQRLFGC